MLWSEIKKWATPFRVMALLMGSAVEPLQLSQLAPSSKTTLLPLNGAGAVQRYTTPPLRMRKLPFHPPLQKIAWQLVLTVKTVSGFWKLVSIFFIPRLPLVNAIPCTSAPMVGAVHSP